MKRKKKIARTIKGFDISMKDWLKSKPYTQSIQGYDRHYLKCCNEVFKILKAYKDWFSEGEMTRENRKELACMLVSYFEDFICEIGIWKTFIEYNKELHGYYLPFYDLSEYDPEYLNIEDIAYLIWHVITKCLDTRVYAPDHIYTMELAELVYDYLESKIEEVPGIADFYEHFLEVPANMDFFELKDKLFWISTQSYLMGWELGPQWGEESAKIVSDHKHQPEMIAPMSYAVTEDFIYSNRCSFAAMNPPEWLSKLARCEEDDVRETINGLKRHQGYYICKGVIGNYYKFQNIKTEREYLVLKKSVKAHITKDEFNVITYIMTLIHWNEDWWLTGIMSGWEMSEKEKKKAMSQPNPSFWSLAAEQQQRLSENTEKMYESFIDLFGTPLALFSNRKEFENANRDIIQHYNNSLGAKVDPDFELRKKEYQEMFGAENNIGFSTLSGAGGYGMFFVKGVGMIILQDIQDVIILLKKKNLSTEEKVELFYDLTVNIMPGVADYLLEKFGKENFVHPISLSNVNPFRDRHYYWRFFHPDEFGPDYPLMTEVSI